MGFTYVMIVTSTTRLIFEGLVVINLFYLNKVAAKTKVS